MSALRAIVTAKDSPCSTPTKSRRVASGVVDVTILVVKKTGRCVFPAWMELKYNKPLRDFLKDYCGSFCSFNGNDNLWGNAKAGADNVLYISVGPRTFLTKLSAQLETCKLVSALYFQDANDVDDRFDAEKLISLDQALQMFDEDDEAKYLPQAAFQFAPAFEALADDMLEQSGRIRTIENSIKRLDELCRWNNSILHAIAACLRIPQDQLAPPKRDD